MDYLHFRRLPEIAYIDYLGPEQLVILCKASILPVTEDPEPATRGNKSHLAIVELLDCTILTF